MKLKLFCIDQVKTSAEMKRNSVFLFSFSYLIFFFQISYLEGVIRTQESSIAEFEADNVRQTQVYSCVKKIFLYLLSPLACNDMTNSMTKTKQQQQQIPPSREKKKEKNFVSP